MQLGELGGELLSTSADASERARAARAHTARDSDLLDRTASKEASFLITNSRTLFSASTCGWGGSLSALPTLMPEDSGCGVACSTFAFASDASLASFISATAWSRDDMPAASAGP